MADNDINRRDLIAALGAGAGLALWGAGAANLLAAESGCCPASKQALKYHHIGIPTDKKHDKERLLEDSKVYITDPGDDPFRIEWCRWMPDSPAPERLRKWPHIAFEVDDVDVQVAKYDAAQVFIKPFSPFEGVKVAFIDHEGMAIEFFQKTK